MKVRTRLHILIVVVFVLISTRDTANAHLAFLSMKELVQESEFIIVGEVLKLNRAFNGRTKTVVRTISTVKGEPPDEFLFIYGNRFFGPQESLTKLYVGEKYLLYIRKFKERYYLTDHSRLRDPDYVHCIVKLIPLDKCIGLIKEEMDKELENKGQSRGRGNKGE